MKKNYLRLISAGIALTVSLLFLAGCGDDKPAKGDITEQQAEEPGATETEAAGGIY